MGCGSDSHYNWNHLIAILTVAFQTPPDYFNTLLGVLLVVICHLHGDWGPNSRSNVFVASHNPVPEAQSPHV
jgi:hypothetical protein